MINVAIFASANGSNAENIIRYFEKSSSINISAVFTNNKNAYVIERCKNLGKKCYIFNKAQLNDSNFLLKIIADENVDFIVLAGFLWLIPKYLIDKFYNKIINIHPALLPKYGGKGMYGDKIHEIVINNNEKESGITIHFVNENYDEGSIIFQAKCPIFINENKEDLAKKIHELEYIHFPKVIENVLINIPI